MILAGVIRRKAAAGQMLRRLSGQSAARQWRGDRLALASRSKLGGAFLCSAGAAALVVRQQGRLASCDVGVIIFNAEGYPNAEKNVVMEDPVGKIRRLKTRSSPKQFVPWAIRMVKHFIRAVQLLFIFSPSIALLPLLAFPSSSTRHMWRMVLLNCLEFGGPTWIKLAQWASTRADLFSKATRKDLERLHDKVTVEPANLTKLTLNEAFGLPIEEIFQEIDLNHPIGAGCIAQVYKGKSKRDGQQVVFKVRRYGVSEKINEDLDLMVFGARNIERFLPFTRWFNIHQASMLFAEFMESQLDLRVEGRNLAIFRDNFKDNKNILFPEPIVATECVLVESYIEGTPLNVFLNLIEKEDQIEARRTSVSSESSNGYYESDAAHKALTALRKRVAAEGVRCFLQMVIVDNWVHADLHSGNILVQTEPPLSEVMHLFQHDDTVAINMKKKASSIGDNHRHHHSHEENDDDDDDDIDDDVSHEGGINDDDVEHKSSHVESKNETSTSFASENEQKKPIRIEDIKFKKFVCLDVGLTSTLSPDDQKNFLDLFKAVADGDGELAGRLMIDRSKPPKDPKTGWPEGAIDPEGFIRGMHNIVSKVKLDSFRLDRIKIGNVLEDVLLLIHNHHIMIDASFTSLVVAIVILEGVGRQLDPTMNIFYESVPILKRADEKYRRAAFDVATKKGKKLLGNLVLKSNNNNSSN